MPAVSLPPESMADDDDGNDSYTCYDPDNPGYSPDAAYPSYSPTVDNMAVIDKPSETGLVPMQPTEQMGNGQFVFKTGTALLEPNTPPWIPTPSTPPPSPMLQDPGQAGCFATEEAAARLQQALVITTPSTSTQVSQLAGSTVPNDTTVESALAHLQAAGVVGTTNAQ